MDIATKIEVRAAGFHSKWSRHLRIVPTAKIMNRVAVCIGTLCARHCPSHGIITTAKMERTATCRGARNLQSAHLAAKYLATKIVPYAIPQPIGAPLPNREPSAIGRTSSVRGNWLLEYQNTYFGIANGDSALASIK